MTLTSCTCREVVDVFSVLPLAESSGNGAPDRGSMDDSRLAIPSASNDAKKRNYPLVVKYKAQDKEPSPQEMIYRSVRRAPIRSMSAGPEDKENREAVRAVMG